MLFLISMHVAILNMNFAPWTCMEFSMPLYYITCACSQHNAYSDWIILGHYSPVKVKGVGVRFSC